MDVKETLEFAGAEVLQDAIDSMADDLKAARARVGLLEKVLIEEANQLDAWADESRTGGWSTHQVEPMRKRADTLRRFATRR